jgi:hypothetical protein
MCIIWSLFNIASEQKLTFQQDVQLGVHGIPLTWNSADTEFRRHRIPSTQNSVDTESYIFFFTSVNLVCYAMLFIFVPTLTEFRIQKYTEFCGIPRI